MFKSFKITVLILSAVTCSVPAQEKAEEVDYVKVIKPILRKKCFSCHSDQTLKGGIDLKTFFFGVDANEDRIVKGGRVWLNVIRQLEEGNMPPRREPQLTVEERKTLVHGIQQILNKSLEEENPGRVVIRRLNHKEYQYSVLSLVGLDYNARVKFASDGSGGAGFDNYSRTLFMTPLRLEQYYEAAEEIMDSVYANKTLWVNLVPESYRETWLTRFVHWIKHLFSTKDYTDVAVNEAEKVIVPFATRAFRRFLRPDEKQDYLDFFRNVYEGSKSADRYDVALRETFKGILVSPKFLYRYEEEQPIDTAYPLGSFELASRLSFFLWSGPPDQELYEAAYRDGLHDPDVLREQTIRMLNDPKARRFSESFVTQWLGISNLRETNPLDPRRYPEFTSSLRQSMYSETVEYFHYVMTESRNFLDILNSDYTFLNEELAKHYGIGGVQGKQLRKVTLEDPSRGGVIGMGSVLASTSLPLRTSPVKRGQFVLEELLGTPAPAPPPDAGELPETEAAAPDASLRELLTVHRRNPSCAGCHQKMDPIGFGLENFDAAGRWRDGYGNKPIIAWDTLPTGEVFRGPAELKRILVTRRSLFARVLAEKMFAYALGRKAEFTDELYIQALVRNLEENEFNTEAFVLALVGSYPFRYAINDKLEKYKVIAKN